MRLHSVFVTLLLSGYVQAEEIDCNNAMTTYEMNQCAIIDVKAADTRLEQYVEKAKEKYRENSAVVKSIDDGQLAWLAYRKAHCDSIHTIWSEGTIRGVMVSSCKLALTNERTHTIWSNYLTFMDSTPPLLPEPQKVSH